MMWALIVAIVCALWLIPVTWFMVIQAVKLHITVKTITQLIEQIDINFDLAEKAITELGKGINAVDDKYQPQIDELLTRFAALQQSNLHIARQLGITLTQQVVKDAFRS